MEDNELNLIMERYKNELLDLNKRRNKDLKDEENPKNEKNKEKNYVTDQKGAGKGSETQEQIEPLERQTQENNSSFSLENINSAGAVQGKRRIALTEEIEKLGSRIKQNSERAKEEFKEFKNSVSGMGNIKIESVSSRGLYPVSNVHAVIFKEFEDEIYFIYDVYTDGSGIAKDLKLPAPSSSLSQTPSDGSSIPYATYDIYIEHPNFVNVLYENVPVFDGITSIQKVEMLPDLDGTLSSPSILDEDKEG